MDNCSSGARKPLYKRKASLAEHIVDDAPAGCVRSALATVLLEQWAWGEIATPQVQRLVQATATDGCQHPELLRLATLGSNGAGPGKCHRDLQRYVQTVRQNGKYSCNGIATGDDSGEGGNSERAHDALPQVIGMLL